MNIRLLFLLFVGLPFMASSQTVPALAEEGVELYGAVYSNDSWGVGTYVSDSAGIYLFSQGASKHSVYDAPRILAGGMTYHDGKIYCSEVNDDGQMTGVHPKWIIYDMETRQVEKSIPLGEGWTNLTNSLTYDMTTDKIYGLARTNFNDFYLARIDPETAEWENMGSLKGIHWLAGIACNRYGLLYAVGIPLGMEQGYHLYRINPADARVVDVGKIMCDNLLPEDELMYMSSKSALFFNQLTGKLYWALKSSSLYLGDTYTLFLEVNLNSGKATRVGYLSDAYTLTGMFFAEPLLAAPAGIEDLEFVPLESGDLEGKFTMKAPEKKYEGSSIEGNLTLVIKDGDEILSTIEDVVPGSDVEIENVILSSGNHKFSYYAIDESGRKGLIHTMSYYAGYDLPYYPKNVKLVAEGLDLILTWDPPTTGIHGQPIDGDNLTYRIVRYPGEEIVEEDFEGTRYEDRADEAITRYTYMVVARYKGQDGFATLSNYMIAGNPLSVPYKTGFSTIDQFYNYYYVVDANNDNCTWMYDNITGQQSAYYQYSETSAADDWLFTPPVNYTEGKTYTFKFNVRSGYSQQLDRLAVTFGNSYLPDEHKVILDIPEVPYEETEYTCDVEAPFSGVGYFGLHIHSAAFGGLFRLFSVSIDEASGLDGVKTDGADLRVVNIGNGLYVSHSGLYPVEVYGLNGSLVYTSHETSMEVDLLPGVYLVRSGDKVVRAVVR